MMDFESTDRRPADYVLFALGFLAFMIALAGVVMSSRPAAVTGFFLLLLVLLFTWIAESGQD